jgi:hypothetical protein
MRSASRFSRGSGLALLVISLGISVPSPVTAQPPRPAIDDRELTLHHPREACGKKWVKKLAALSEEEYAWMARYHHGLYDISLNGQTLATIEILNTPNVTYFLSDGSQKTQLTHTAVDPTFVNQAPKVYPLMGKALLIGVDVEGNARSRWLALAPLQTLYAEAARSQTEDNPVLASQ